MKNELYVQKREELSTMNQLLSQIWTLQDKVNALNEEKECTIRRQRAAVECPTFPVNPPRIPSPRGMLSRDSGLPHFSRSSMGTSGNVFESPSARQITSPSLPGIATRHGEGLRREPQSTTIPTLPFTRNRDTWNSTRRSGGNYSQNCTIETPRYAISALHFGEFPDPDDFQCWRVTFKTELCVSTSFLQLTVAWINEVKLAGSIDDLLTSQSIEGDSFLILRCLMRGLRLR